jgi:hypothetical protein
LDPLRNALISVCIAWLYYYQGMKVKRAETHRFSQARLSLDSLLVEDVTPKKTTINSEAKEEAKHEVVR